jgi:hypothetical protein
MNAESTRLPKATWQLGCLLYVCFAGCATWLPTKEEPTAIPKSGFSFASISPDSVGVETILVRLNTQQAERLPELWQSIDEQALSPELRQSLDKNGLRAGKISAGMPSLLEQWIGETVKRVGEDPMEQAGFAADVSSYSQLWRCRANSKKELTIRKFSSIPICLFFHDGGAKGHVYTSPHLLYSIQAAPAGESSAKVKLTPVIQHGEPVRKMVEREAAFRFDTQRESVSWDGLTIDLQIKLGDCIMVGPTAESRGLGEHFLHTKTQSGEIQPVLMLVRLSEAAADKSFQPK